MSLGRWAALALLAASLLGCGSRDHRLRYVATESQAMGGAELGYGVYLPPGFDADDEGLPLVVLLHGGGDAPSTFDRWDVGDHLDRAIAEGRIPPCVIVLPQGDDGFWINWHDGSRLYEDWILRELIPEVRERYHTAACPDGCHVMGMSMGGFGALHFAMEHPGHFDSATIISAPIFDTEQMRSFVTNRLFAMAIPMHRIFGPPEPISRIRADDPYVQWRSARDVGARLFVAWGTDDRANIRKLGRRFVRHLRAHDIPHEALEYEGGHDWESWTPVIERALAHQLGADR